MKALPLLLVGALAALACGGPEPAASPGDEDVFPRRVFFVTVDTLRADRLGAYGHPRATSPFVDRLAAEGLVFEQAVAQWPKTGASFASMFTGAYPQTTGLTHEAALRIPDGYLRLPELFRHAGYTTVAVVSNGVLNRDLGWDGGFDRYEETWHIPEGQSEEPRVYRKSIAAPRVNALALPLLDEVADAGRLFFWLHYSDPHAPYVLPEGMENPFVGDRWYVGDEVPTHDKPAASKLDGPEERRFYDAQYDANVLVVDRHLEAFFARARELGLLEDALVVFTADHGESLGEHGYWFGHGRLPYNTTAHVPLVFWAPGRIPPGRVNDPVELVDLYPTLRDLIAPGEEVAGLEGRSLAPLLGRASRPAAAAPVYAFAEAGGGKPLTHFRTVQDARWKLVYHPPLGDADSLWELYDLASDPGETRNLIAEGSPEAERLRAQLTDWMKGATWIRRDKAYVEERSAETERALKALGYL